MQSILVFEGPGGVGSKRRKSMRACRRCQQMKKRCRGSIGSACERCEADEYACSFQESIPTPSSLNSDFHGSTHISGGSCDHAAAITTTNSQTAPYESPPASAHSQPPPSPLVSHQHDFSQSEQLEVRRPRAGTNRAIRSDPSEQRYQTMLDMLQRSAQSRAAHVESTKLIGDSNPLSALLRKELKQKLVDNLCAFRAPDPTLPEPISHPRRLRSTNKWNWEEYYLSIGVLKAKVDYLRALGCFEMPETHGCSQLLETYFTYVHPLVPVIDRKEFLLKYYSLGEPPPLVLITAVFLAASRYCQHCHDIAGTVDSRYTIREQCDRLHTRLRALSDVDITSKRLAVMQAAVLGSLHWEGREGVNSATDSLSLAVRIGQEMGVHRLRRDTAGADSSSLLRRIWWCTFAFDRLNAATEGSPFLINELDCDAAPLSEADFEDEDSLTMDMTMFNVSLALIIQDTVRQLYSPSVSVAWLYSTAGLSWRHTLGSHLDDLSNRISDVYEKVQPPDKEAYAFWISLFRTHICATRILVHRPFLLYAEDLDGTIVYSSREMCRSWAYDIVTTLSSLRMQDLLRFSWPFTVYSLVNALLLIWYDFSSQQSHTSSMNTRNQFLSIISLLETMGHTWWAAAAKHKLAEALFRVPSELSRRVNGSQTQSTTPSLGLEHQPLNSTDSMNTNLEGMLYDQVTTPLTLNDAEFWASVGLDFENDVAGNVYSIYQ